MEVKSRTAFLPKDEVVTVYISVTVHVTLTLPPAQGGLHRHPQQAREGHDGLGGVR